MSTASVNDAWNPAALTRRFPQPSQRNAMIADDSKHTIAGSATLLIEYKFIRQCGKVKITLLAGQQVIA